MAESSSKHNHPGRFLVWTEAGAERQQALPERGSLTLGSDPGEGQVLQLDQPGIDEAHCVIGRTRTGGYAIKDLGSLGGTRVNGEPTTGVRLRRGDRIELGSQVLYVVGADDEGRPLAPRTRTAASAVRRLGGFRIEERLGKGGMGEVLAAVQESLARKVALKLLNRKLGADEDFVRRFQAEARAAAALNHPNVVHVYDVGVVDGQHYLAMEFMAGGTLEGRLEKEGPLPASEVLTILSQTAQALVFAEERGIVHRDIKPDNLMLDGAGTVKLADLGLATTIEAEHQDEDQRILGTPHFMAPEQARGGKVDHRSDLYALGATAFRLLTGETVFAGDTTRDILRAHFTEPPRAPGSLVGGVPPELDELVLRMLAKEPEGRPQSARELAALLADLEGQEPVSPRSRLPLVGAGALVVAAIAGFLLFGPGSSDDPGGPEDPDGPSLPGTSSVAGTDEPGSAAPGEVDPGTGLPGLPGLPVVETPTVTDDDAVLENLERLAQQAYGGLAPITDPSARMAALEELASSFPGTTVATEAGAEAAALQEQVTAAAAAAAAQEAEQASLVARLAGLVQAAERLDDGAPADPDGLVGQLLAEPAPGAAGLASAFEAERRRQVALVLASATEHARDQLELAETQAAAGDFDGYQATLEGLLPYFEADDLGLAPPTPAPALEPEALPDDWFGIGGASGNPRPKAEDRRVLPPRPSRPQDPGAELDPPVAPAAAPGRNPAVDGARRQLLSEAGWDEFAALADRARARLAERPAREQAFRLAQARADRANLAAGLGPGLLAELSTLELGAAGARLVAQAAAVSTTGARDAVARLAREVSQARDVLDLLAATYTPEGAADDQGWRRSSVPDPAGGYVQALGADAAGITVEGDSGGRLIAWHSYGGSARLVDSLFKTRLRRDYTPEENLGIASLARLGAVVGAVAEADRILVPSDRERFTERDAEDLLEAFEVAGEWCQAPEALAADQRERDAAAALAQALLARVEGDPTTAAALLADLLDHHRHSLLVLLLSDGRGPEPAL